MHEFFFSQEKIMELNLWNMFVGNSIYILKFCWFFYFLFFLKIRLSIIIIYHELYLDTQERMLYE